ncbi:hypothetical protein RFI_15029 [Reticulomyxa filosa]|uniref:RING-type domain-containing protein n=1 Tax=Reticulomyxa filosa TaxID=46433 RepID=X6N8T9_RETFI|nr:hypothetical protein RFI_15029 [Reticulomyxa filosa]|eukprot:ETO22174.1 hypothetical protein RFI_15029 [Reticulomyxa filosa]
MGLMVSLTEKIKDASASIDQLELAIALCRRQTLVLLQHILICAQNIAQKKHKYTLFVCAYVFRLSQKDQVNESTEALWDCLLDECLSIQQDIALKVNNNSYQEKYSHKVRENMKTTVSILVGCVLEAMMGMKINLSKMFAKIVDKCSFNEYLHYRDTVDVMLSTYQYETNMLQTAVHLFSQGAFSEFEKLVNSSKHSFKAPDEYCKICEAKLQDVPLCLSNMIEQRSPIRKSQLVQIFACGHAIHIPCLVCLPHSPFFF